MCFFVYFFFFTPLFILFWHTHTQTHMMRLLYTNINMMCFKNYWNTSQINLLHWGRSGTWSHLCWCDPRWSPEPTGSAWNTYQCISLRSWDSTHLPEGSGGLLPVCRRCEGRRMRWRRWRAPSSSSAHKIGGISCWFCLRCS